MTSFAGFTNMFALREDTASQEIILGPFVDATDGSTAETALTIANTDIKIWKHGATTEANKNSGGATHIASGRYYAVLDATDTDTAGNLRVSVHVAGALPVWVDCFVYPTAVYDLTIGTTALGTQQTGDAFARLGAPAGASIAADIATVDTVADGIKAKTDSLTFTQAGHVDANVQRVNDVAITGDGSVTPFNV